MPRSGFDEGMLDGQAALAQADTVRQPPNTPIYFGMDFEYEKGEKPALDKGIIDYFKPSETCSRRQKINIESAPNRVPEQLRD